MDPIIPRYPQVMDPATAFRAPFSLALKHWPWALGLMGASFALSLLAPLLQVVFRIHGGTNADLMLQFITFLPFEMYLLPRFLVFVDATVQDHPFNLRSTWSSTFEHRWIKAFAAKMLLGLGIGIGLSPLVLPGVLVFLLFCWMPYRVLLRGEAMLPAMRASAGISLRNWLAMAVFGSVIGLLCLAALLLVFLLLLRATGIQPPTPWMRLTHPAFWAAYMITSGLQVPLALACLGLYHLVEPKADPVPPDHLPK